MQIIPAEQEAAERAAQEAHARAVDLVRSEMGESWRSARAAVDYEITVRDKSVLRFATVSRWTRAKVDEYLAIYDDGDHKCDYYGFVTLIDRKKYCWWKMALDCKDRIMNGGPPRQRRRVDSDGNNNNNNNNDSEIDDNNDNNNNNNNNNNDESDNKDDTDATLAAVNRRIAELEDKEKLMEAKMQSLSELEERMKQLTGNGNNNNNSGVFDRHGRGADDVCIIYILWFRLSLAFRPVFGYFDFCFFCFCFFRFCVLLP